MVVDDMYDAAWDVRDSESESQSEQASGQKSDEGVNGCICKEEMEKYEAIKALPLQAELKQLERRYTSKRVPYIVEPREPVEQVPDEEKWFERFALCVIAELSYSNEHIIGHTLQVNAKSLKHLLRDVIGDFPSQTFSTKQISVQFPPRALFHYRQEIEAEGRERFGEFSEDETFLEVLLNFIDEQFKEEFTEGKALLEEGFIKYEHLWTIFRPGITVSDNWRAYELKSYQYKSGLAPHLSLSVDYIDYDGYEFGTRSTSLSVYQFEGVERVRNLEAFPFVFCDDLDATRARLIERGHKFEALAGQNFVHYTGIASSVDRYGGRVHIDGRVMIDCKTVHRLNTDESFSVSSFKDSTNKTFNAQSKKKPTASANSTSADTGAGAGRPGLTDDQALLANTTVRGFSFAEKRFLDFSVNEVSSIKWNERCFDQLVLPSTQKELVQALVSEHTKNLVAEGRDKVTVFDDIVKGKGKGLVLVLHGPPGVGKTLTAECVAEFAHRPLYVVSSGDLGTKSEALDQRLTRIMDMTTTWKAVLLIDEADVFLARRTIHDLERNGLVSIFLRVLEYYQGILFLTTNRIKDFDDAFKSRIHVPLRYKNLDMESRKQIWKNFLRGIDVVLREDEYDRLSKADLNGRQIKNVVRTAKSLASYKNTAVDCAQPELVTQIQADFQDELDADSGGPVEE